MNSKRVIHCTVFLALVALWPAPSSAQPSAAKPADASSATAITANLPTFEIADVHSSPWTYGRSNYHWNPQGTDRFLLHQASLLDLITFAYVLDPDHVFGGPTSLGFNHYEVIAKQPVSTPIDTTRLMVRTLLADRFKLVVHEDTRPMPAQLLTVGKAAPKMKPAANSTLPPQCQFQRPPAPPTADAPPLNSFSYSCRNMTMQQYAQQIARIGQTTIPILDQTGLKGAWDFDVIYTLLPSRMGYDIANDLDQIGLKLSLGQGPQPVLVIDHLVETPTPNSQKLAELLPPPTAPEFDVAVVKPSSPDETSDMNISVNPSGQVTITRATLQILVGTAYNMSGANIADPPDFVVKDRWDIIGKIPQDAYPKGPNGAPIVSPDDISLMIRALLVERFGLKAHFEDRPEDRAWVATVSRPKLKKTADPTARTNCDTVPPPGEKDPRNDNPNRSHSLWCRNITIGQFASLLVRYGWDYNIKSPVLDATHIDGSYDIVINWSTGAVARGLETINGRAPNAGNANSSGASEPGDPTGAITMPDAISQQLGLKLQMQRRNMPRIVLDHIEKKPTEN